MSRTPYILDRRRFLTALGLTAGSLCLPSFPGRDALAQAADPKRVIFYITPHGTVPGRWHMRQPGRWNSRVYGFNHQHAYNYVGENQPAPREQNT